MHWTSLYYIVLCSVEQSTVQVCCASSRVIEESLLLFFIATCRIPGDNSNSILGGL